MEEAAASCSCWLLGWEGQDWKGTGAGAYFLSVPFLPFLHQHCQLLGSEAIGGLCEKKVPRLISHVCREQRKDK